MKRTNENQYTFEIPGDLSPEEHDELLVLLHRHSIRLEDNTVRDISAVLHSVVVFCQAHAAGAAAAASAATSAIGLANALISWGRERRKRQAEDKAAQRPSLLVVAPDQTKLDLYTASEEKIREFFLRNPNVH